MFDKLLVALEPWEHTGEVLLFGGLILFAARWLLARTASNGDARSPGGSVLFAALVGSVLVALILALPISDGLQGSLLSFLGLLITGAIALSSTTFVGNAMAGLMLRSVRNFRPGDFVRVGEHFGRVSEVGLLHTEIQTEDRDLTTLANLYLVQNPVTVVSASGTIISSTVSLGYDVDEADVEAALLDAANRSELADPFVQVRELGDFSITYRVCGFLADVKYLISNRTKLNRNVLAALHERDVEIVSPSFVNYRRLRDEAFIPNSVPRSERNSSSSEVRPEDLMFDKAEQAESRVVLETELADVRKAVSELADRLKKEEKHGADLEQQLESLRLKESLIETALEDPEGET